jgi:hypothetical protein
VDAECHQLRSRHLAIAGGRGPRLGIPLALGLQALVKEYDKRTLETKSAVENLDKGYYLYIVAGDLQTYKVR